MMWLTCSRLMLSSGKILYNVIIFVVVVVVYDVNVFVSYDVDVCDAVVVVADAVSF